MGLRRSNRIVRLTQYSFILFFAYWVFKKTTVRAPKATDNNDNNSISSVPSPTVNKTYRVALCSCTIGAYSPWTVLFQESHKTYARRHGYDFIAVDKPLDPNVSSLSNAEELYPMQRLLAFSREWSYKYDYVILVDENMFITCHAPPIHTAVGFGQPLAMADEFTQPSVEARLQVQQKLGWDATASAYFEASGFPITTARVLNTNLIVGQPAFHGKFLEELYYRHYEKAIGNPKRIHFMQAALGSVLLSNNSYVVLPNEFNPAWFIYTAADPAADFDKFQEENHFLNFAGYKKVQRLSIEKSCIEMPPKQ